MKNNLFKEIFVAILLVVLLLLVLNPWHWWMPSMMTDMILILVLCAFGVFSVYLFQEKVADEREANHRMLSGRAAFLAGSIVLIVGIIVQSFRSVIDPWLPLALGVMILVKIGTRVYTDRIY